MNCRIRTIWVVGTSDMNNGISTCINYTIIGHYNSWDNEKGVVGIMIVVIYYYYIYYYYLLSFL